MKPVHVSIRQIGNSRGFVVPKPILAQVGLDGVSGAQMSVEGGALVLRRPAKVARAGWAQAAQRIAAAGNNTLVMGEFINEADSTLVW
jgi:antitoxin MazE